MAQGYLCSSFFGKAGAWKNDLCGDKETFVFFCDPNAPYQKPHVENNHTLFRSIVPDGSSFDDLTQDTVNLIFSHVNAMLRKRFKASPHNSVTRKNVPFSPSTFCKNLDLHPVNHRFLQSYLTQNSLFIAPPHLCGAALTGKVPMRCSALPIPRRWRHALGISFVDPKKAIQSPLLLK